MHRMHPQLLVVQQYPHSSYVIIDTNHTGCITTPFRSLTVTAGLPASPTPGGYTIALWSPTTPAFFQRHLRHLHRGSTGHPSLVCYNYDDLSMSSPTSTTLGTTSHLPPFHAMPTFVRRRLQHQQHLRRHHPSPVIYITDSKDAVSYINKSQSSITPPSTMAALRVIVRLCKHLCAEGIVITSNIISRWSTSTGGS
jgi:hypothetical protein